MRLGLLLCDHVDERFRAVTADYDMLFRRLLGDAGLEADAVAFDAVRGQLPKDVDDCDAYLVTGSRFSAYDDEPWIDGLAGFLKYVHGERPVAGICFGHQLLAKALGGQVERAPSGWGVGIHGTELAEGSSWDLIYMHQDQVVELPAGADILGSTDHCPIAMFAAGPSTFGMQAHPEFAPAYTEALLRDRTMRIGEAKVAAGIASLAIPASRAEVAGHLAAVLGGADARTVPAT